MSKVLPKFELDSSTEFANEEEFQAELKKSTTTNSIFSPGIYDVKIVDAFYDKPCASDKTFQGYVINLAGAQGKKIGMYLNVPTTKWRFGKKESMFPTSKVTKFLHAIGIPEESLQTKIDVMENIKNVFSSLEGLESLEGKELTVSIGYNRPYIQWVDKDDEGNNRYEICMKNAPSLRDSEGNVLFFNDRDAAINYAENEKIAIQKFPDVLETYPLESTKSSNSEF